ncbi:MAG: acyl-CoA synthetase [Gammaproteobacteria bacterium]|nr:acyl-CoA synthetase [Gammaproteobacteria bacterium]|tara:strand:- start:1089 stop:2705 length:1617 start_codon:yes stop_codon:yes gene_type:complete
MAWNYGDILDGVGEIDGARPALIHGDRTLTWADFTRRTNNLARRFLNRGAQAGDKVAFYLRNCPAYSEMLGACFKARLTHVNVNYRYVDEELHYILDNSDSRIVVYGAEFADHVAALRERLPDVWLWIEVTEGEATPRAEFAVSYEELAEIGDGAPLNIERSGDDMLFLYTGGTTGMPKGVMWAHDDLWHAGAAGATPATDMVPPADLDEHCRNVAANPGGVLVPCCPQMHGTGLLTTIAGLAMGGTVVTLTHPSFDPAELWEAVERHKVNSMAIVGDAFAKPMLRELDQNPDKYDISSVMSIVSSGVMWSPEVKQGLLRHNRNMVLTDSFGASEAVGFGRSDTTADGTTEVAKFQIGEHCKVFTEDFREIEPGSDEAGFVARSGAIPRGYYKDEEKTAKTFPVINGVRYSMPGDYCKVAADGTLLLLGRGSVCINTAGEKVYPEEVEEVLKTFPGVTDALVVGVPDEKWGQMVTGVVQPEPGATLDEAELQAHVRGHLAGYKTPKRILFKDSLGRASNGKADYKGITAFAKETLGVA